MTFQEVLNEYLTRLGCTARELSAVSGISAPVISHTAAAATARTWRNAGSCLPGLQPLRWNVGGRKSPRNRWKARSGRL